MMRKQKYLVPILAMSLLLGGCFHEHTWTAATCIAPATCSECGELESEELAEHVWAEATCGAPKTCTVCALTEGEATGEHNWTEATCEAPKTCTVCGATEGQKLRHESTRNLCSDPLTCVKCGLTVGEPKEHTWIEATCVTPKTCRVCSLSTDEFSEHTWKEATCFAPKTCKICDETEGEALSHDLVNNTCTRCGYYVRPSIHPNAAYAAYFGIDPNIKWVENADTRDEIVNNILWNALNGDFDLDWIRNTPYRDSEDVFETIRAVSQVYPEIIGAYLNVMGGGRRGSNFYVEYDANPLPLSYDDVHNQNLAALAKAQAISKKLHDNGTITEDMSELDIVKVYYDYLDGYIGRCTRDESVEGTARDMFYDSAYACLVNKDAACGGKAAGFNMLMHVEGITAQGVAGQIIGTGSGHIMSRVVADGKEYFVDWGNQKPIGTYDQTCKWFNFNHEDSAIVLELARAAYQQ